MTMGVPMGGRSPLTRKSLDHVYGTNNLVSDNIGKVVGNDFMQEAAQFHAQKMEKIAQQKAAIPKGLKSKQTVTSLLRREANR